MLHNKKGPAAGDGRPLETSLGNSDARRSSNRQSVRQAQFDLFDGARAPSNDPLLDLVVSLPDLCKCGAAKAVIGAGRGPHLASLRCCACESHRGWLGHQTHSFLTKIVNQFGRPSEPVAIRRARDIGFISSPDLMILPRDRVPLAIDAVEVTAESNPNGDEKCR
jgi:hypothetical protein